MEKTICYIIINLLEALIAWQYCSNLFRPKFSKKVECILFITFYAGQLPVLYLKSFHNNILIFIIINFSLMLILYHIKWYTAIFHTLLTTVLMSLSELSVLGILSQLITDFYAKDSYIQNIIILTASSKILYFIVLRFIIHLINGKKEESIRPNRGTLFLYTIPFISLFIIVTLTTICLNVKLPLSLNWMIAASSFLLISINLLIFWIYNYNQAKDREFMELQLLLQKESNMEEYYKMLLKQNEDQKILIHDIKRHLQSLATLNEQGEQKKIATYIEQVIHSSDLQDSIRVCDNGLLNAILCRYIKKCNDMDISLHHDIRNGLLSTMPYNDLTSLFCNLLDNAVDAAATIPKSYIELSVTYRKQASLTIITMINSCQTNPFSKNSGLLISHKQDNLWHGYGMKSIERIVNKYDGNMQIYYDKDSSTFHTIIAFKER